MLLSSLDRVHVAYLQLLTSQTLLSEETQSIMYSSKAKREDIYTNVWSNVKWNHFLSPGKKRTSGVCKVEEVNIHCYCCCPEYGVKMVFCDGVCGERFHVKCIESPVQSNRNWYCKNCVC